MDDDECIKIAEEAFQRIGKQLPSLKMNRNTSAPVELSIDIPIQPGLKYAVNLNLQNRDELHFSVENFWLEWFPCTEPSKVDAYVDAVSGFLSGRYRIIEHYRGKKCTLAELQEPLPKGGWSTIGSSSHILFSLSWSKTQKEIKNA